jgi:hypothetical protein
LEPSPGPKRRVELELPWTRPQNTFCGPVIDHVLYWNRKPPPPRRSSLLGTEEEEELDLAKVPCDEKLSLDDDMRKHAFWGDGIPFYLFWGRYGLLDHEVSSRFARGATDDEKRNS